jgi:hypothetical protein
LAPICYPPLLSEQTIGMMPNGLKNLLRERKIDARNAALIPLLNILEIFYVVHT